MYNLLRPLLFSVDPELAHELSLDALSALERLKLINLVSPDVPSLPKRVMGLDFPNPVGLAAGLDKDAQCFNALGKLGFGFVEVGTVTPVAQPGNDKPRLFRLKKDEAIINRMGFNNSGLDQMVERLKHRRYQGVLGVNLGKNKVTPEQVALNDYLVGMRKTYEYADYLAINISSPNTPGLRNLQYGDVLESLISGIANERENLAETHGRKVPVAVKVAPDNDADTLKSSLSGAPVRELSTQAIYTISQQAGKDLPIIGVGGIASGDDAVEKYEAGASLVQLYTGFIYKGPALIEEVVKALK